jgi:pimeloyl-ACP methyl ester carboxylesterase
MDVEHAHTDAEPLDETAGFLGLGRSLTFPFAQWRGRDRFRTVFFDEGCGPALVFVHGLGGNATHFEALAKALASRHRVIGLDLVGCGWSAKPDLHRYTPALLTGHLLEFLDRLGVSRAVLLGHSLGCAVVTSAALLRPGLARGLALIAPVGVVPPPRLVRLLSPLVLRRRLLNAVFRHQPRAVLRGNFVAGEGENERVRSFLDGAARDADGGPNVQDFARVTETLCAELLRLDLSPNLARLDAPVLALAGDGDRLTAPALERLRAPNLTRALIERCGHMPMIERPEEVLSLLNGWLEGLEERSQGCA